MISQRLIVIACLVCLFAAVSTLAQGDAKPVRDFNAADVNKDGKVTPDEFVAHTGVPPEKAKKIMQRYDRDAKGYLLPHEFDAWKAEENFDEPE